jgi:hypothetical protein
MVGATTAAPVVLFGGQGNATYNDTWTWNGTTWTLQMPSVAPPIRLQLAIAYDGGHGQVVIFGGNNYFQYTNNDTWVWQP